jgi:hypothetical protein
MAEVFDAEAEGARHAMRAALLFRDKAVTKHNMFPTNTHMY